MFLSQNTSPLKTLPLSRVQNTPGAPSSWPAKSECSNAEAECIHSLEQEARPAVHAILNQLNHRHDLLLPSEAQELIARIQERGNLLLDLLTEITALSTQHAHLESHAISAPSTQTPPINSEASTLSQQLPLRILVAEDNRMNQALMIHLLECFGYSATVVSNGLAVLNILEQQAFDLILMDVQMPGLDGLETSRQILARYGENRPRLIALTALSTPEARHQCLKAGMDDYLLKPLALGELERLLMHWACHFNPLPQNLNPNASIKEPSVQTPQSTPSQHALPADPIHPLLMQSPEQLVPLLNLFAEEGETLMAGIMGCMEQALINQHVRPQAMTASLTLLKRNLHQLKGACSAVGGKTLRPAVVQMEQHLRTQGLNAIEPLAAQLNQAWVSTLLELKTLQAQLT